MERQRIKVRFKSRKILGDMKKTSKKSVMMEEKVMRMPRSKD